MHLQQWALLIIGRLNHLDERPALDSSLVKPREGWGYGLWAFISSSIKDCASGVRYSGQSRPWKYLHGWYPKSRRVPFQPIIVRASVTWIFWTLLHILTWVGIMWVGLTPTTIRQSSRRVSLTKKGPIF